MLIETQHDGVPCGAGCCIIVVGLLACKTRAPPSHINSNDSIHTDVEINACPLLLCTQNLSSTAVQRPQPLMQCALHMHCQNCAMLQIQRWDICKMKHQSIRRQCSCGSGQESCMMQRAERQTCRRAPMPDSAMCSDMQSQDVEVQVHVDAKVCLVLRPQTDNPVSYRPYLRCGYACTHRCQPGPTRSQPRVGSVWVRPGKCPDDPN